MGLLEEATISGINAAKQVLDDLFFEKNDKGAAASMG